MRKQSPQPSSLTTRWSGLTLVLKTQCWVTNPFSDTPGESVESLAIWDTGATNSVISQKIVDILRLQPFGLAIVNGVGGEHRTSRHVVGIALPNRLHFSPVEVTLGQFDDFDILIGMDIISTGSFAVTNRGGKTIMSFSHPSLDSIDFVQKYPTQKPVANNPQSYKKRRKK